MRTALHSRTWVFIAVVAVFMCWLNVHPRFGPPWGLHQYAVRAAGWPLPIVKGTLASGNDSNVVVQGYYESWGGLLVKNGVQVQYLLADLLVFLIVVAVVGCVLEWSIRRRDSSGDGG